MGIELNKIGSVDITSAFKAVLSKYVNNHNYHLGHCLSDVLDTPTSNFGLSETSVGTAIVGHYIKKYFPDNYSGSFYEPLVVGGGACDKLQLAESQKQESLHSKKQGALTMNTWHVWMTQVV